MKAALTVVRLFSLFVCFGLGVAFFIGTIGILLHPNSYGGDFPAEISGMFAALFLLGAVLLFRRDDVTKRVYPTNVVLGENAAALTDRFRTSTIGLIKIICEDTNPSEVRASAHALASVAGFLVGFAAARTGKSFEQFEQWCREGFQYSAAKAYRDHCGA